jgi:hypothetical protein
MQRRTFWLDSLPLELVVTLLVILALGCSAQATAATPLGPGSESPHRKAGDATGTSAVATTYLPIVVLNDCLRSVSDDFANPASGWFNGDTSWGKAGYLNGRYRIQITRDNMLVVGTLLGWLVPDEATIRVRAQALSDSAFGLVFGFHSDIDEDRQGFYTFMIHPSRQQYELRKWTGSAGANELLAEGTSTAIRTDSLPQMLEVRRSGSTFKLFVNDVTVRSYTVQPDSFPGPGLVGLSLAPRSEPLPIAYYDDFTVNSPRCIVAPSTNNSPGQGIVSPCGIERGY